MLASLAAVCAVATAVFAAYTYAAGDTLAAAFFLAASGVFAVACTAGLAGGA